MYLSLQSCEEIDCFILEAIFCSFSCHNYNMLEISELVSLFPNIKAVLREDIYNNWRSKKIIWYLTPQPNLICTSEWLHINLRFLLFILLFTKALRIYYLLEEISKLIRKEMQGKAAEHSIFLKQLSFFGKKLYFNWGDNKYCLSTFNLSSNQGHVLNTNIVVAALLKIGKTPMISLLNCFSNIFKTPNSFCYC